MKSQTAILNLIAVVLLAIAACPVAAAYPVVSDKPVVIPLHRYAHTSLMAVGVQIGSKKVPFLFDTGAGLTVGTPSIVKQLGCKPFGQVTGYRAGGRVFHLPRCGSVTLHIAGYTARGEIEVFDLMALLKKQNQRARKKGRKVPKLVPLGGLVSLASFRGDAITLDFAHNRIIVESTDSLRKRLPHMMPVKARMVTEPSGATMIFIEAMAKVGTLWLELDSGNNGPTFLSPHALKQLGIQLPQDKKRSLSLQLVGIGHVPVTVQRRAMIYDGQLGIKMIKQFIWTIDLRNGQVWVEKVR